MHHGIKHVLNDLHNSYMFQNNMTKTTITSLVKLVQQMWHHQHLHFQNNDELLQLSPLDSSAYDMKFMNNTHCKKPT